MIGKWKLKTDKTDVMEWHNTVKLERVPYRGSEHRPKVSLLRSRGDTYPFKKGWQVVTQTKSGYSRSSLFRTKKEALSFARSWMKDHPEGV